MTHVRPGNRARFDPPWAGFTLIELLVVISIIGLLSSIVITSLNVTRVKAQYAALQSNMNQIQNAVIIAESETGKRLGEITGNWHSFHPACDTGGDLRGITNQCYTDWVSAITAITNATSGIYSLPTGFLRDPWGSPYLLDENEGEKDPPEECWRQDELSSAGPDGIWNTADDYILWLPFVRCQ